MERICIVCGEPISDDNDLRDQFGCHTDIHAHCYPEVCAALEENKRLRRAMQVLYVDLIDNADHELLVNVNESVWTQFCAALKGSDQ